MIDFVLTWVDGSDPAWRAEFEKYNPATQTDANSQARFRDFGTLKYVFRGIDKFTPWVHKVHFITSGHRPAWLNAGYEKINILTHEDIFFDRSHLPTFNSNAIEVNFLGIRDLADQFVIFNDDTLILKPVGSDAYFKNGFPCDFLIQNPFKGMLAPILYPKNTWVKNIKNAVTVINREFDKAGSTRSNRDKYINSEYGPWGNLMNIIANISSRYLFFEHYHHPQPYLKKTWEEVFSKCGEEIRKTSSHRFRERSDVTQYLFRYWNLVKGTFSPRFSKDFASININSIFSARTCANALSEKTFVCVNDVPELAGNEYEQCNKIILRALDDILPDKSGFEF